MEIDSKGTGATFIVKPRSSQFNYIFPLPLLFCASLVKFFYWFSLNVFLPICKYTSIVYWLRGLRVDEPDFHSLYSMVTLKIRSTHKS